MAKKTQLDGVSQSTAPLTCRAGGPSSSSRQLQLAKVRGYRAHEGVSEELMEVRAMLTGKQDRGKEGQGEMIEKKMEKMSKDAKLANENDIQSKKLYTRDSIPPTSISTAQEPNNVGKIYSTGAGSTGVVISDKNRGPSSERKSSFKKYLEK